MEDEIHKSPILLGPARAVQAAGTLKHRRKHRKRKLTKFDKRYTELGPLLKPDYKRVDYVLVHNRERSDETSNQSKKESLQKKERLRKRFEDALRQTGFSIKSVEVDKLVFTKLHCPFKRLCEEAERVKLEMPLEGCEKYPPARTMWITEFIDEHFETDNEVDYISAPFKMNKIEMFEGYDNPTHFFRPSLRSLLTHHILINIDIKEAKDLENNPADKDKVDPTDSEDAGDKDPDDKKDPKDQRDHSDHGDPKANADQSDPKGHVDHGDPKANADQSDPKCHVDHDDPKANADQSDPKDHVDHGDPKANADQSDPKDCMDHEYHMDHREFGDHGERANNTTLQAVEGCINDFCFCCPCFMSAEEDKEDRIIQKMGLPYLQMKGVYEDAFILHEDSNLCDVNEETDNDAKKTDMASKTKHLIEDPRKEMDDTWCRWWKFQPLWKIRNYFGEKIGLYFAWAGMLLTSLWLPMLFGLACFIYGLTVSISRSQEEITMPTNLTLQEEFRWHLKELYQSVRGAFDNDVTPFFALVICLWGTVFLEFWKRQNANLAYEWDVDNYEANEPDRPEFFGTKVKKDPVTREDNWFYPFKRQLVKFFLSTSALIFMVSIVLISVAAVVVYRVIVSVDYCTNMTTVQCLIATTIISALLNALSILLLGRIYDWIALKLTDWENHRTQTAYDDALIIKLFAFQFANSYASCFYIAFFRGRFDTFGVFGLGEEYADECDGGSCMSQLSFQILVLMLVKPFPKFFKDIILPFIKRLWRIRPDCCRSNCCKNKVEDEEKLEMKEEDTVSLKRSNDFLMRNYLKPKLEDFTLGEYTEKVIIYGFLMLFAASFPLAPLVAMLWLAIDLRIDAKRLLWFNRRPVAFIAQDLGMWYGILNFVNLVGVISNGFLIAFTSAWGLQFDIITRLWICIGFEHIVFALKFIMAYIIPDVPKEVRLAIRREKYQVFRKMEDKGHAKDYTELVPQTTYNYKVHENSGNYSAFDDPMIDDELRELLEGSPRHQLSEISEGSPKHELKTVVEEEEEAPNTQTGFAESHGTISLRGIDTEGNGLLHSPNSDSTTHKKKSKSKHKSTNIQKPAFVTNREDSTISEADVPLFPPKPSATLLRQETDASIGISENEYKVDPYAVVKASEIGRKASLRSLDDDEQTQC